MSIILYIHQDTSEKGDNLKRVIEDNFKKVEIESFNTFNAFKSRLKKVSHYNDNENFFILFADSENRLQELVTLIDLLEDRCIILVLSDDKKSTLSMSLKFFPRFITFAKNDYTDLCSVLNKMMEKTKLN
jgi:hypothetical protein